MLKIFKSKINKGDTYAVQCGDYAGQFFHYIEKNKDNYMFLATPVMEIREVPIEKFDFAVANGIIDYVEKLPRNTFKVIKRQYEILSKR